MTELVEGLLTLARADEGRAPLPVERTDLRDLVAEASETAGMLAESGRLKVTTVMPKDPVWVMVDRRRIREMLLNLVTNAIKYTPAEGKVELSLADANRRGGHHRAGHGHRHRVQRPAAHLRAILAGGPGALTYRGAPGQRTRPRHHEMDCGSSWRDDHRVEPAGPGHDPDGGACRWRSAQTEPPAEVS